MPRIKTIHAASHHLGWDHAIAPLLRVAPGERVALELLDASRARITRDADADRVLELAPENANPLSGPVWVDGAEPGDTLVVELLDVRPDDWGWTAIIPGFGLLHDQFAAPWLHISEQRDGQVHFGDGIRLPARPFVGTLGVAPAAPGNHSAIPPLPGSGGNLDLKHVVRGSRACFPVQVPGALFSAGDGHAAQGHGEVCGTAVETCMSVEVRFGIEKGRAIASPWFHAPAPAWPEGRALLVTTGIDPDLFAAARDAVRYMIDLLAERYRLAPERAYALCSVAADLEIAELVNAPNWTVACSLPDDLFT